MSCFIHKGKESVASCKRCGKNMCDECSSLSGHTGICPTCLKPQFERELFAAKEQQRQMWGKLIGWFAIGVLLCFTIIIPLYAIYKLFKIFTSRKKLSNRINDLEHKLSVINSALGYGSANI